MTTDVSGRIDALLTRYRSSDLSVARALCDDHDPAATAWRFIGADLSARDLTYGELRAGSERFAAALRALGVKEGDRVATLMGKSRAYVIALMSIWRLGAVHVPLFTAFAPAAIATRLSSSAARVVVCDEQQEPKLAPGPDMPDGAWQVVTMGRGGGGALSYDELTAHAEERVPAAALGGDAPLIHISTSGTTGTAKGVVVPSKALATFQTYVELGLDLSPADVFWNAADPGWAYGLYYGVLATLTTGVRSLMFEGAFTPETTLAILAREGVTNFAAAPTVYRALRAAALPRPVGLRLRRASSAGEPLTPDVNDWAREALGVEVHDHYGQTEAGMLVNNHHHPSLARPIKPGSMGQVMPGWSAAILHEERDEVLPPNRPGRLAMDLRASPLAWFAGYEGDPAKSAEKFAGAGRYYLTGDVASVDEDGYCTFSSRDDDVIIMAGYRIGPIEVEATLARHPAVAEAAVVAAPDALRGEVVEAFVVLRAGATASPALCDELQAWVKTRYAAHAYPRRVHFVDALPKTPSGKLQRFVLKARRRAELGAS
ncbi:MAG: AMP-binding protein [Labilithrix sp.]|nr:AMP-binding protein [Labilithrix sp.]